MNQMFYSKHNDYYQTIENFELQTTLVEAKSFLYYCVTFKGRCNKKAWSRVKIYKCLGFDICSSVVIIYNMYDNIMKSNNNYR